MDSEEVVIKSQPDETQEISTGKTVGLFQLLFQSWWRSWLVRATAVSVASVLDAGRLTSSVLTID